MSRRVVAFATQGAGGNDEARLRALLANVPAEFFPFDRAHKLTSARLLLRELRRCDLAVMEGTGIAGGLALLLSGAKYVVSSGDAVEPFVAAKQPLLGWLFALYERLLCRRAAGFIGWSPYLAGRALTFGARRAATAAGWAWFTGTGDRAGTRARLGIPAEALVIGIAGSLDWNPRVKYCYGYELARALPLVNSRDVRALIVGSGNGVEHLRGKNVILTGTVAREEIPDYLAAMDIASLPQSCDGVGSFRYTTKLSEYIAAGLPVVTGQLPLAYDLDGGWMWRLPGDAPWDLRYIEALAAVLNRATPEELSTRRAAVPRHCEIFDRARQVARITSFLHDILESR